LLFDLHRPPESELGGKGHVLRRTSWPWLFASATLGEGVTRSDESLQGASGGALDRQPVHDGLGVSDGPVLQRGERELLRLLQNERGL